jgi:hypothetical protein
MSSDTSLRDSFSSISFVQQKSFYDLASHFRSEEMDAKIKAIINKVSSPLVDQRIKHQILNPVMTSMANYKPVDIGFANLLVANRNMVYAETESVSNSSSGGMSPWTYVVIGIIVLRLILLMARCGRM